MTSHFCNFFCSQGCLLSSETMCSTAYRSTQNRQIETSYFQSNIIKLILEDSQFLSCEICVNCTEIIVVLCRFKNLSIAFKIVTAEVEWLPANQQYRKIHSSNKSIMQATFDFERQKSHLLFLRLSCWQWSIPNIWSHTNQSDSNYFSKLSHHLLSLQFCQ